MITGTGVPLETIIARHNAGDTPLEIHEGFPTVSIADVYSVIAYYLSNRKEVDAYVQRQKAHTGAIRERFESDPAIAAHLEEVRERIRQYRTAHEAGGANAGSESAT